MRRLQSLKLSVLRGKGAEERSHLLVSIWRLKIHGSSLTSVDSVGCVLEEGSCWSLKRWFHRLAYFYLLSLIKKAMKAILVVMIVSGSCCCGSPAFEAGHWHNKNLYLTDSTLEISITLGIFTFVIS